MARQVIDTTPPIGTPAPTAFGMINAMTGELYPLATGALQKTGGRVSGELLVGGAGGWRMVADGADVYMDARANVVSSTLPDGNALYRGASHRWTNSSGNIVATMVGTGALNLGAGLTASGEVRSLGTSAGYGLDDRTDTTKRWSWYASGGICRLWAVNAGDRFWVNEAGQAFATGFNPTSSADVKDYIEGYSGDADAELDRLVVIEYNYRPGYSDSSKRVVGLLAENVADVHPSASGEERMVQTQIEVEREVEVEYPVQTDRLVEVRTPVEDFDPDNPQYDIHTEIQQVTVFVKRWEKQMVSEMVETKQHRTVDIMQILALNTRAHQQKSKRIRDLEAALADAVAGLAGAVARIEALEGAA